jgi:hypothetical protein
MGTEKESDTFIGRVGQFTPMKLRGGNLFRVKDGKRYAASGTKGYLWLETTDVENLHLEDDIDRSYYISKCEEARDLIAEVGDFDWFVGVDADGPITMDNFMNYPDNSISEVVPFN